MKRDIERFNTNGLKIIILLHDAITRVDLAEYNKLRKNSFQISSRNFHSELRIMNFSSQILKAKNMVVIPVSVKPLDV